MVLKSFYRKSTTKIYLLLFVLLLVGLGSLILSREYHLRLADLNYADSFIYVPSEVVDVTNIPNTQDFKSVLYDGRFFYAVYNDNLGEKEILFPSRFEESFKINDIFEFIGIRNNISFIIFGYYQEENYRPILYINSNTFQNLIEESYSHGYLLSLDEWSQRNITIKHILSTYNIEPILFQLNNSNIDFTQLIANFTIFVYVIIVLFVITSIFTIYNIFNDEKEKKYIYSSLGYSKKAIFKLQLINILSLFGIALACSIILTIILRVIF